jgi:hypothetical protein
MIDWTTVIVIGIIAAGFTGVSIAGFFLVRHIGVAAFQSGAAPRSADSFGKLFLQFARISTVSIIVISTVFLALTKNLTEGAIGILSGVAGYVLGGVGPSSSSRSLASSDKPTK